MNFLTTLGQLNFFKWAISREIITFVEQNLTQIVSEMNQVYKEDKKKKKNQKESEKIAEKKRGKTVTVNAKRTVRDDEVQMVLTFK